MVNIGSNPMAATKFVKLATITRFILTQPEKVKHNNLTQKKNKKALKLFGNNEIYIIFVFN